MSDVYQPKLDPNALLMGYTGADPKSVGTYQGYTQQQVDRSKLPAKESKGTRKNPYIR